MPTPKRLIQMAIVAIPFMMMYFILRVEVFKDFGTTEDVVAAMLIGSGSALLANYMWPQNSKQDDEDRS